jgi:hypothetical protein
VLVFVPNFDMLGVRSLSSSLDILPWIQYSFISLRHVSKWLFVVAIMGSVSEVAILGYTILFYVPHELDTLTSL